MSDLTITNPYSAVNWEVDESYRFALHPGHIEKLVEQDSDAEPADYVDLYHDAGFDILAVNSSYQTEMAFPWTDFDELDPSSYGDDKDEYTETRDPEQLGMIAVPAIEAVGVEHVVGAFTTVMRDDIVDPVDDRFDARQEILANETFHEPESLAWIAHSSRYVEDGRTDWARYRRDFNNERSNRFLFEVVAKGSITRMRRTWDHLNSFFAPNRTICGVAANDVSPGDYVVGQEVGTRLNELFMDPEDFDPSDQKASRLAIVDAIKRGQFVQVERDSWEDGSEDPPEYHLPNDVTVEEEAQTITVSAPSGATVEWFSGTGDEPVETGETIQITDEHVPFVRAVLSGSSETYTQPFGVGEQSFSARSDGKWDVESDAEWDANIQS